ncbi:hypothetical protein [Schlesneria paludicola]|uniref:hypothetical protein n=1 Tax=Schlesneria paludicola TaxID=360056 RepID=UPI00029B26A5|nr:hypothetical protein [Schlesneria paludicola]
MRLEDTQLEIRPRSILECLDLAFLFCSRHWLGLLLAGAAGMIPAEFFSWWIDPSDELNLYLSLLIATLLQPWATMFVTLYLGQVIFSPTLSLRRILRDAGRALPAYLAFQLLLKGLCLASVILSPIVFLGMYYLDEIILLEKPRLSRIWKRRTAMNSGIIGRIFSLCLIDTLIAMGGALILALSFRAVTALWEDHLETSWLTDDDEFIWNWLLTDDWQGILASNLILIFLTVFRFMTYLDNRIRREGWDVELKLRAQAELYREREATT